MFNYHLEFRFAFDHFFQSYASACVHASLCEYVWMHACVCVLYVYVKLMCVRVFVCMCVCVCVCVCGGV